MGRENSFPPERRWVDRYPALSTQPFVTLSVCTDFVSNCYPPGRTDGCVEGIPSVEKVNRKAMYAFKRKETNEPMSRSSRISLSLREDIETYGRYLTDAAEDGVITADELGRLRRTFRSIERKSARIDDSLRFIDLAMHGDGIDGPWFERNRKEELKGRAHLRIVAAHDDGPRPSGPAARKAA